MYASRPISPPRDIINAACVALCMQELPLVSKHIPFTRALGEIEVIGMGAPKLILKLPEYELVQSMPTKAQKKDGEPHAIRILISHVEGSTWVSHSGPRQAGNKSFVYTCNGLALTTAQREAEQEGCDSQQGQAAKKRRVSASPAKSALKNDIRVAHNISECNAEGALHHGLRPIFALGVAVAEIEKAKRRKCDLDLCAALRAVECDPFAWQPLAHRRRLVLLLKAGNGEFHAALVCLSQLLRHIGAKGPGPRCV